MAVKPGAVLHQTIGPMAYAYMRKNHSAVATFPVQLPQCFGDCLKFMILV